jgi:hypothetical protein
MHPQCSGQAHPLWEDLVLADLPCGRQPALPASDITSLYRQPSMSLRTSAESTLTSFEVGHHVTPVGDFPPGKPVGCVRSTASPVTLGGLSVERSRSTVLLLTGGLRDLLSLAAVVASLDHHPTRGWAQLPGSASDAGAGVR